jgi:hypothetical protein
VNPLRNQHQKFLNRRSASFVCVPEPGMLTLFAADVVVKLAASKPTAKKPLSKSKAAKRKKRL